VPRPARTRNSTFAQTGTPRSVGRTAVPVDFVVRPVGEAADERRLVRRRANPDGAGLEGAGAPVTGPLGVVTGGTQGR
ncbi:hypothetical protein ACFU6I_46225, partial [Streptomyces sp. NPDC057486]|uniref:hypothetical protein n=1 Tax=Streptomyces sp. NPDC057486 TaxID=3346145 RepID=UPI00367563DD